MMKRYDKWLALGGLAATSLCAISLFLLRPTSAQAPQPAEAPTTELTALDPHWLKLVRGEWPQPGLGPEQTQAPQTLNVLISDQTVAGRTNNVGPVLISQMRGTTLIASLSTKPIPDGSGFFYATKLSSIPQYGLPCYPGGNCFLPLTAGDVIQVAQAGSLLTMTVPAMTALAYPKEDVIRGTAPPSQTVAVSWFSADDPNLSAARTATVTAISEFTVSLAGAADVRPRDSGFVALATGPNATAYQKFIAPFLRAQLNGSNIMGYASPFSLVNLEVRDARGIVRTGSTIANGDGEFIGGVYSGTLYSLAPGDVISASGAQAFSMMVEPVSARASYTQAQVTGTAPANRLVLLEVLHGPISLSYVSTPIIATPTQAVTSTSAGTFSAAAALQAGDYGTANISDAEGNQTYVPFTLPYLRARMGEAVFNNNSYVDLSVLMGQLDVYSVPVTITIQGKSGYIKDIRAASIYGDWGYFNSNTYYGGSNDATTNLLSAGDVVTVASRLGAHIVFALPTLTAQSDTATDTVVGTAPPNSVVRIKVGNSYAYSYPYPVPAEPTAAPVPANTPLPALSKQYPQGGGGPTPTPIAGGYNPNIVATLVVTTNANGLFSASFAGLVDITSQSVGEVEWISPQGYTAVQSFRAQGYCAPRLYEVNLSRSTLGLDQMSNCPQYTVRLLGANGAEKAALQFTGGIQNLFFAQRILPNDTIELIADGRTTQWRVPSIAVALNPATDVVSGTAPPNSAIQAWVVNAPAYITYGYKDNTTLFTATVGASGVFTKSLGGILDIAPGTTIRLSVNNEPRFVIENALLWTRTHLYQPYLDVTVPNQNSFSLTVQSPGSSPIAANLLGEAFFYPADRAIVTRTIVPGDQIKITSAQQMTSFTVPTLSAKLDVSKRTVTGQAPPNARLHLILTNYGDSEFPQYDLSLTQDVTANAAGAFTATFTGTQVMPSFGSLVYFTPEGNEVEMGFGAARWHVFIGSQAVDGRVVMTSTPSSLTLRGADGSVKSQVKPFAELYGGTFNGMFTVSIASGDRIELAQPDGFSVFIVPVFTARHDAERNVVEGQTVPNALITLSLPQPPNPYNYSPASRRTQANASGRFALDITGLKLQFGAQGVANVYDSQGNSIGVNFTINSHKRYLPIASR